ncbi:hypothetical protein [Rhizobium sp. NXC14]|uniref:hypothetical protein n=1 Tax=Rhizobium sp. NXC14 TaxID=1981173 RepID=UPI0018DE8B59|nr:hypothetical protein [Rhizobium sp. NXC14]
MSAAPPIEAAPPSWRAPLSFLRHGLWYSSRLADAFPAEQVQVRLSLHGKPNEAVLQSELDLLVACHEPLRTPFGLVDGEPFRANVGLRVNRDDLRAVADFEAIVAELIGHGAQMTLNLDTGRLIRARLLGLAVDDHLPLITVHNISDHQLGSRIMREFSLTNTAFHENRAEQLSPLRVQCAEYDIWQRRALVRVPLEGQPAGRPLSALVGLILPTGRSRPLRQNGEGAHVDLVLHEPLAAWLKAQSRCSGTKLLATILSSWSIVFARFELSEGSTFETLLKLVRVALSAIAVQELLFGQIVESVLGLPIKGYAAMFPAITACNYYATPVDLLELKVKLVFVADYPGRPDLALEFGEVGGVIQQKPIYATKLFEQDIMRYLGQPLTQISVDLEQRVCAVALRGEKKSPLLAEEPPPKKDGSQDLRTLAVFAQLDWDAASARARSSYGELNTLVSFEERRPRYPVIAPRRGSATRDHDHEFH